MKSPVDTIPTSSLFQRSRGLRHLTHLRMRAPFAEFLGTFLVFLIGFTGTLSSLSASSPASDFTIPLSWGLGVFLAIIATMSTSGAHLNPAVTLLLIIYRGFPARRAWGYFLAQFLGALIGTAAALGLSYDKLQGHLRTLTPVPLSAGTTNLITSHVKLVGSTLFTGPKEVTLIAAFFNEFTAAALLGIAIFSLEKPSSYLQGGLLGAFCMCWVVVALALGFGGNTGACMNPIRDLAPRLIAACAGCGWSHCFGFMAETGSGWWLWGPFGADIIGLLFGGGVYTVFVGAAGDEEDLEGDLGKAERGKETV
jgi:aquaglyceroporin related protein